MSESMFMSLDDEFGKNGYIIRESKIQKGCEYPVHWHDYFEFEVILDGTGIHTLNDRKYTVSAGSAFSCLTATFTPYVPTQTCDL